MEIDNEAGVPGPFSCPHCGVAGEVHWYKDAYVRYQALNPSGDTVPVDGATLTVIRYDDNELVCGGCDRRIEFEGRDVQIVPPTFRLDREALERGFAATRGSGEAPLSLLPGGDLESFGEFAEGVARAAVHDWQAIRGPEFASVRLQPLFPQGEQLLPIVVWGERTDLVLAGPAVSRDVLVSRHGRGLATACVDTAAVVCGFAVDAANEILGHSEAVVEFTD